MRKYVKNHGIIFGGPQNFVGFSTGPWTGKGWETLLYSMENYVIKKHGYVLATLSSLTPGHVLASIQQCLCLVLLVLSSFYWFCSNILLRYIKC
jgi:hypothetical protein